MFKKIVMVFVLFFAMESFSYGARLSDEQAEARNNLWEANKAFMELMLGSEGIKTIQSTPDECCQMIDGCLTAGITDRLYGFPDQSPALQAMAATLDGIKRDHALLAIEFYAVGYLDMHDNSNRNTPARFDELCGLAFQNGSIFEYKNRLEDEIKRASQPLRYAHFGIGVAPAVGALAPSVAASALPTPPPRMDAGLLGGIAGGGGGLRKNKASSTAEPSPVANDSSSSGSRPPFADILRGTRKKVLPKFAEVAPPAPPLPVDQAVASPPPAAAVDAAPPRANLGLFSGSEHLLKRAEDLQNPEDHDPDSDDYQEVWK